MRRALAIAVIAGSVGCKTDDARPPERAPAPAPVPRPAPRGSAHAELIDTVLLREPRLPNATPLAPLRERAEREQITQSWCVAGTDAEAIASSIAEALTAAGWGEVTSRGTPERAAASGTADGVRLSITVGGRDATCPGLVASALYTTSTVIIPPVDEGERVR